MHPIAGRRSTRTGPPLLAAEPGQPHPNRRAQLEKSLAIQAVKEDFESMLMDSFLDNEPLEGTVVKGKVVAIEKDLAIIDVGLKTEGRIALKEFGQAGRERPVSRSRLCDRVENAWRGALTREGPPRESWVSSKSSTTRTARRASSSTSHGRLHRRLSGANPSCRARGGHRQSATSAAHERAAASRSEIGQARAAAAAAPSEESRAERSGRPQLKSQIVSDGVVKNITHYGAFVDLAARRPAARPDIAGALNHPSVLSIGGPSVRSSHQP